MCRIIATVTVPYLCLLLAGGGLQPAVRIDLDNPRGAIRDFIAQEPVQKEIAAQFKNFLRNYTDASGDLIYRDRMRDMCTSQSCLLPLVSFSGRTCP